VSKTTARMPSSGRSDTPDRAAWRNGSHRGRSPHRRRSDRAGDLVLALLPEAAARLAAERHYLPPSVAVVKRVAALASDFVCADSGIVVIDSRVAADTPLIDRDGSPIAGVAWLPGACSGRGLSPHAEYPRVLRQPLFRADPLDRDHRQARANMDLVTILTACVLGARTHAASSRPALAHIADAAYLRDGRPRRLSGSLRRLRAADAAVPAIAWLSIISVNFS
jgi:hypothetical protein